MTIIRTLNEFYVLAYIKRHSDTLRANKRHSETLRDNKRHSETLRDKETFRDIKRQ